jgi:hypothetical protein
MSVRGHSNGDVGVMIQKTNRNTERNGAKERRRHEKTRVNERRGVAGRGRNRGASNTISLLQFV